MALSESQLDVFLNHFLVLSKKFLDLLDKNKDLEAKIFELQLEQAKLKDFKEYVHQRLDQAGIPTHPSGLHSAAGCRIGDRLDFVLKAQS